MAINRTSMILTDEQLREIQLVELEILIEVDRICRKNNISYILGYGTLLGTIRHQGFIPWDDDIDVLMLRDEYDRFCEACKNDLYTDRFFWQTWDTDSNYRIGYGKMRRLNTAYVRTGQEKMKYHGGMLIDIMPMDNLPDKTKECKDYMKKCMVFRKIMYSKAGSMCEKNFFKRLGFKLLSILPEKKVKHAFEQYILKYKEENVTYVNCLPANGNQKYIKSMFFDRKEALFEGYYFYIPRDYDLFLKPCYGADYMTPPPINERHGHAPITAYKSITPIFPQRDLISKNRTCIITVAGLSTRFSESIGSECLKCIYYEIDREQTLLYRMIKSMPKFDRYIIVGGYKYDELKAYVDEMLSEYKDKIDLVKNDYYAEYGSGYSLYCGMKKALEKEFDELVFCEGDLIFDKDSFTRIYTSHRNVITYNSNVIDAQKSVVFYLNKYNDIKYIYDTTHNCLNISEEIHKIYNSGQIWKMNDIARIAKVFDEINENEWQGTNLIFIQKYFENINKEELDILKIDKWINCNTVYDWRTDG